MHEEGILRKGPLHSVGSLQSEGRINSRHGDMGVFKVYFGVSGV